MGRPMSSIVPRSLSAIVLVAMVAMASVVYRSPQSVAGLEVRFDLPIDPPLGPRPVPVFAETDDGKMVMYGEALRTGEGLVVRPQAPGRQSVTGMRDVMVIDTDLRVLWMLAGDPARDLIRRTFEATTVRIADRVTELLESQAFRSDFRPVLGALFADAADRSWANPAVQTALADLVASLGPELRERFASDIRRMLVRETESAVARFVERQTRAVLELFVDVDPVRAPAGDGDVDARLRDLVRDALGRVTARPEFEVLVITFAGTFLATVVHDEQILRVLAAVPRDPRLSPLVDDVIAAAIDAVRPLPRALAGLGQGEDPNPLAAKVLRNVARGYSEPVVVLLAEKRVRRPGPQRVGILALPAT